MKKWYQERYFARRDWLLENLNRLEISPLQGLILLLIDYYQEGRQVITMENLATQCHCTLEEIDAAIDDLCKMDYLVISSKNRKVYFDISGVFEDKPKLEVSRDLFEVFEREFGRPLSQKETMAVSAMKGFTNATDAADYLVNKGVSFRDAHAVIGKLVLFCIDKGKAIDELSIEEVVEKKLQVIDLTASMMALENKVPMIVFGLDEKDSIVRAANDEEIGTRIKV